MYRIKNSIQQKQYYKIEFDIFVLNKKNNIKILFNYLNGIQKVFRQK